MNKVIELENKLNPLGRPPARPPGIDKKLADLHRRIDELLRRLDERNETGEEAADDKV